MAVAIVATYRALLPAAIADAHPATEAALEPVTLRHAPRLLRILAPIAMLGILCMILQRSAAIWSAIYLADVLARSRRGSPRSPTSCTWARWSWAG